MREASGNEALSFWGHGILHHGKGSHGNSSCAERSKEYKGGEWGVFHISILTGIVF